MNTDFAAALASPIYELARFFHYYVYLAPGHQEPPGLSDSGSMSAPIKKLPKPSDPVHEFLQKIHEEHIQEPRSKTFDRLFGIFELAFEQLKSAYNLPYTL
ncbi:hypothetical protein RhiJN_17480 [Ceratobasidium sp. AG-Ba]|nr:hypothetical protein RhiJN_17480 [Ceratobasidium sp. AG-Ba]